MKQNVGVITMGYGDAQFNFHYVADPEKPEEDYTFIVKANGEVIVREGVADNLILSKSTIYGLIFEQFTGEKPKVVYVKVK